MSDDCFRICHSEAWNDEESVQLCWTGAKHLGDSSGLTSLRMTEKECSEWRTVPTCHVEEQSDETSQFNVTFVRTKVTKSRRGWYAQNPGPSICSPSPVMPPRQAFLPWLRHLKADDPLALPCGKAGWRGGVCLTAGRVTRWSVPYGRERWHRGCVLRSGGVTVCAWEECFPRSDDNKKIPLAYLCHFN